MTITCECGHAFEPGDAKPLTHRLAVGDSTSADTVSLALSGRLADLCVTSPPYNCQIEYDTHVDSMEQAAYLKLIGDVVAVAVDALQAGRFVAWNVGVTPKSLHIDHALILRQSGLQFYRQVVWAKAGVAFPIWQYTQKAASARNYHPNYTHEVIYMFSKGDGQPGGSIECDDAYSRDVWHVHQSAATRDLPGKTNGRRPKNAKHGGSKQAAHPAAYPVGIPGGAIAHLTARGELVLDPFSGSGTTMVAADNMGRRFAGVELSPNYAALSIERLQCLGCTAEIANQ